MPFVTFYSPRHAVGPIKARYTHSNFHSDLSFCFRMSLFPEPVPLSFWGLPDLRGRVERRSGCLSVRFEHTDQIEVYFVAAMRLMHGRHASVAIEYICIVAHISAR
jgi:hypothetical protein